MAETPGKGRLQGRHADARWSLERFLLSARSTVAELRERGDTAKGDIEMNNKPVYLTAEGLAKLKAELDHLVTSERPRIAARIHDAKLDGDITENAEYEDAKQEQSFLEGRIGTLEAQLKNAEVIEKTNGDRVGIGSKVVIRGTDGQETFTIVGSAEAAPREGRISNESPVGAALMGHKKGDTVIVEAPAGEVTFTVVSIH
jgi:transcription elongation factor GreA